MKDTVNLQKTKAIPTDNLEQSIIEWAGEAPPRGFIRDKEWGTRWGHNNVFAANFSPNGQFATAYNWHTEKSQTFYLKKYDISKHSEAITLPPIKYKPKEKIVKDRSKEFEKYKKVTEHNYLSEKKVESSGLELRVDEQGNLLIPFYDLKSKFLSGWQIISRLPKIIRDDSGNSIKKKFKKWVSKDSSNKDIFLSIGKPSKTVYLAEGISTALSIFSIVFKQTVVSFGKKNLDSLAENLLKDKDKLVVMCLDYDIDKKTGEDTTHKTTLDQKKYKNLIIRRPEKPGDFNDFSDNKEEILKLKYVYKKTYHDEISKDIKEAKITKRVYLDSLKLLIKGYLGVIFGEKVSMKSRGTISYLLDEGIKFGYFSDSEQTDKQIKGIARATGKEELIKWYRFEAEDFWERLPEKIERDGIKLMLEDPPLEDKNFNNIPGTRQALGKRARMAELCNISWLLVRNFSKADYTKILDKVGGFAIWTNLPRFAIGMFKVEDGHKYRKNASDPKVSLMQTVVTNEGPLPQKSLLLKLKTKDVQTDEDDKETVNIGYCNIKQEERVKDPENWVKAPTDNTEKEETREYLCLSMLREKEGLAPDQFKEKVISKFNVSSRTADRIISKLKERKLITGGGSGNTTNFKLTDTGRKSLNQ